MGLQDGGKVIGEAVVHGAGTIVNAIACGKGSAFGVDLWTRARVELTDEAGVVEGRILNDPEEDTKLIRVAVRKVLEKFNVSEYGARVITESNIPVSRGLKSSSAAANAVVLATLAALGKKMDDVDAVLLGVEAAIEAGVTVTGAFDDACASYFGGVVVTDNEKRSILRMEYFPEEFKVVILVPSEKIRKSGINVRRMKAMRSLVEAALELALRGDYLRAMTLNGLAYSASLGLSPEAAVRALEAGAVAAGLSGTGPATVALVPPEKMDDVVDAWSQFEGNVMLADVNNKKAQVSVWRGEP
ncbi:MAG: shikimate kinase [Candidatus Jordarchaeales archaeon]|nr:shikimate kinase [Candidatus Jordarchaeia archaeon]